MMANTPIRQCMNKLILITILVCLSACETTNTDPQAKQGGTSLGGITFSGKAAFGIARLVR